jgi:hypothetical protein
VRPRAPYTFATRVCVHCGGELPALDSELLDVRCDSCGKHSTVTLCEHQHPRPAWRVVRWGRTEVTGKRRRDVVAVAVGDVTVFLGRLRDMMELRTEDGSRLPVVRARAIEPGAEVLERLTAVGQCYRCSLAFFLPDGEIAAVGPPRVLRIPVDRPTRQYMKPEPEPSRIAAAYATLGTAPAKVALLEDEP